MPCNCKRSNIMNLIRISDLMTKESGIIYGVYFDALINRYTYRPIETIRKDAKIEYISKL